MAAVRSLGAVDGQCFQQANPGGGRNLYAILCKDVVGNYPLPSQIDEATQRLTALPTLVTGKKWSQYNFPDGTLDYKVDDSGDPGYQSYKHSVEFALAGSSDELHIEMDKFINAGVMFLIEDKNGEFQIAGSTDDPIFLKKSFALGKKGNDKRGYTLKGEVDGLIYGVVRVTKSLMTDLTFNTVVYTPAP
jgi:hypothetical protein